MCAVRSVPRTPMEAVSGNDNVRAAASMPPVSLAAAAVRRLALGAAFICAVAAVGGLLGGMP